MKFFPIYIIVISLILLSCFTVSGQTPSKKQQKIPVRKDTVTTATKYGTMTVRKQRSGYTRFKFDPDQKEFFPFDSVAEVPPRPKRKK